MRYAPLLQLLLLLSAPGLAQESRRFPHEILSMQKSKDEQRLALTTADSVYVLDARTLTPIRIWKHGLSFPTVYGFHPTNPNLLLLQQHQLSGFSLPGISAFRHLQLYLEHETGWQETLSDSLLIYNIDNKSKIQSAPGNFYVQFGSGPNEMGAVLNRLTRKGNFADSAEIFTQKNDRSKNSTIPKACRRIQIDDRSRYLAASWYDPRSPIGKSYAFSIHDFDTHEPLIDIPELPDLPTDFRFSPAGTQLAVSGTFPEEKKKSIRIYDLQTRQLKATIPHPGRQLHFAPNEETIEFLDDTGVWVEWNLAAAKKTRTIWSNLTELFAFENVIAFGDRLLFTGSGVDARGMADKTLHQLESVVRKDLELFSTIDQPFTEQLTDTSQFTLLLNDVSADNEDPTLRFSFDRSRFTAVNKNQLQIWNTRLRKKLFQRPFHAPIRAYPDRYGNAFLILEQKGQMSFSEYRMHRIDLIENEFFHSGILSDADTLLKGTRIGCDCLPDPEQDNTWLCLDGGNTLWQIRGNDLRSSERLRLPGQSILAQQLDPNGTRWLRIANEKGEESLWKWPQGIARPQWVGPITDPFWAVSAQGYWTWNKEKQHTLRYWENDRMIRTDTLPGPIQRAEVFPDQDLLLVQFARDSRDGWQMLSPTQPLPPQFTRWIGAKLYPLCEKTMLVENEGFSSVKDHEQNQLSWSVSAPRILSITNFSVSAEGRFLLLGNSLLDLKEIAQAKTHRYHSAALLQDSGKMEWIELVEDRDFPSGKSRFQLIRIENNGADTLRGKTWFTPDMEASSYYTQTLTVSPDRQWVIANWEKSYFSTAAAPPPILWNTRTLEGIPFKKSKGESVAYFSADGKTLILHLTETLPDKLRQKEQLQFYALAPFRKIRQVDRTVPIGTVAPTNPDLYRIRTRNLCWYKTAGDSTYLHKEFYSRDYLQSVVYHAGSDQLLAGTDQGSIHFWDRNGYLSPTQTLLLHAAPVARLEIRGDRLYSLGEDGSVAILDIPRKKILVNLLTLQRADEISTVLYTPDGFYRAEAGVSPLAHFVRKGIVYPISSFEYQGNRPDKVYAALGFADSNFISLLKNSWEARLKRAGLARTEKPVIPTYPTLQWNRPRADAFTTDSRFRLSLTLEDPHANRCQLFIRINGVPVGSRKGETIDLSQHKGNIEKILPLSVGKNRISVQAINEAGQESVEQEFELLYQPTEKKPVRIFYAGVGVSAYADSNYDLRYAAKDVLDISADLHAQFDSIVSITLTNEKATRETILQLHAWLRESNTDDIVILSLSGHGLTDPRKGFIYAPHDMNFNDPAQRGVSMEELESILDDIPARKRLMLLDACHSGEAWADTIRPDALPPGVSITPRGLVVEQPEQNSSAQKQAFLLMKELFSDLTRGNGAFMISAAGSNEFAFEGNQWKNGVFTLSLLESLRDLRYRSNHNGPAPIPLSQLRKKIYEKVKQLTKGLQNPTSRQENGWWDWSL